MVDYSANISASGFEFHEINIPDFEATKFRVVTDFYAATHKDGFIIYKKMDGHNQPSPVKSAEIKDS